MASFKAFLKQFFSEHRGFKFFLAAVLVFGIGAASGAILGFWKAGQDRLLSVPGQNSSAVLGADQTNKPSKNASENFLPNAGATSAASKNSPPAPPPSNTGSPSAAAVSPAPKVQVTADPCASAAKPLAEAKTAAQAKYAAALAAGKVVYDQEQEAVSVKLQAIAVARNQAVNNYLTAIALATSQYNAATSTQAYATYQNNQQQALNSYTQTVTSLDQQGADLNQQKQASQDKYANLQQTLQKSLNDDLTNAEVQYEQQIAKSTCPR